jgi:hypothetical protein
MKTLRYDLWPENVLFYFVVNGVRYGPEVNMTLPKNSYAESLVLNQLYETENYFYVLSGSTYTWGLQVIDGEIYLIMGQNQGSIDEMVAGKPVAGVRYFNMAGQEMQEANGICIAVITYTDGTTSAVKVVK